MKYPLAITTAIQFEREKEMTGMDTKEILLKNTIDLDYERHGKVM